MSIESEGAPEAPSEDSTLVEKPDAAVAYRKPRVPNGRSVTSSTTGIFGGHRLWGVLGVAVTAFAMTWYFLHFAHLTIDIHRGYGDSAFAIGLYDQGVWLLS